MRILFHLYIPSRLQAAGIQQSIRVCYYLSKMGATVHLHVCTWFFKNKMELLDFFGLKDLDNFHVFFYWHPFKNTKNNKLLRNWGNVFHFLRFLKLLLTSEKMKYDVYFARGFRFPALHILFKSILRYKVVFEFHEIIYLNNVSEDKIYKTEKKIDFEKFCYLNADGVIAISSSLKNLAEKKWGERTNITVIPSGTILFKSDPLLPNRSLKKIYFIGNYYPFSGLDFVIKALVKIPGASLTVVGGGGGDDDSDYQRVKALIETLHLQDRVILKGFIQPHRLPEIYAEADILVMPHANYIRSKYFVSPLKLFEYMSARRPIVASDLPTIREILRDGYNAVLAQAEDIDSIIAAISKVINDPLFASKIAEKTYHDVKKYSMEKKCKKILEFISGLN